MTTITSSSSSSSSSSNPNPNFSSPNPNPNPNPNSNPNTDPNNRNDSSSSPIQSYYSSISKARSSIMSLSSILSESSIANLSDSESPTTALLSSATAYFAVSAALSSSSSGSSDSPLCQWLYETYNSSDSDLKLAVLSFAPLIINHYLSRLISSPYSTSLAGFESVILSIYQNEARARAGKPVTVSIPDLSKPSLYHSPKPGFNKNSVSEKPNVGVLSGPLEPHNAVKSTKRGTILGVVLECYFKKVAAMPVRSKVDFCELVVCWAGQDCQCRYELDDESTSSCMSNFEVGEIENLKIEDGEEKRGCRVLLPWEMTQPILRILGHCLLAPRNVKEVRDAAAAAVRSMYARAMHDLMPQAILASRSLIQLDKSLRKGGTDVVVMGGMVSNPTTPCKPKKPEVLLASK